MARGVSLDTFEAVLSDIEAAAASAGRLPVVFNTCDGLESDGYPGVSVSRACERRALAFTGADVAFYEATTAKTEVRRQPSQSIVVHAIS